MADDKAFLVRIPAVLHAKLTRYAKKHDRTMAQVVRDSIRSTVERSTNGD